MYSSLIGDTADRARSVAGLWPQQPLSTLQQIELLQQTSCREVFDWVAASDRVAKSACSTASRAKPETRRRNEDRRRDINAEGSSDIWIRVKAFEGDGGMPPPSRGRRIRADGDARQTERNDQEVCRAGGRSTGFGSLFPTLSIHLPFFLSFSPSSLTSPLVNTSSTHQRDACAPHSFPASGRVNPCLLTHSLRHDSDAPRLFPESLPSQSKLWSLCF